MKRQRLAPLAGACLLPCSTCPWRVDKGASDIPNYDRRLAWSLLGTVGEGDEFRQIMKCHGSPTDDPRACKGYLAREGWSNINVRLLLCRGEIASPDAVLAACEAARIELHGNYPEVLEKLERTLRKFSSGRKARTLASDHLPDKKMPA